MNCIEILLTATGMEQKQMAELLGVTPSTVCRWMRGDMSMNTVRELSKLFEVSYPFLFGETTESGNKDIDRALQIVTELKRLRERNGWV